MRVALKPAVAVLALLTAACLVSLAETPPRSAAATRPADLGEGSALHVSSLFPADNPWNKDISREPVDPSSAKLIASIGLDAPLHPDFGRKYGIPYVVVAGKQPRVPVSFEYAAESDPGPYPVPPGAPIEGGPDAKGDRHVLVLDRDNWKLYELYSASPVDAGKGWKAGSGAVFDLRRNTLRPAGWTSADAAGLPILPGLVRYEEVYELKAVTHAIRFTCVKSRRAYVPPATHWASRSKDASLPPMGMRVRLKADYDVSKFSPPAQVILQAMKKYGLILADNGSNWFITGSPDPRWDEDVLNTLKKVRGRDFEVVRMEKVVAD